MAVFIARDQQFRRGMLRKRLLEKFQAGSRSNEVRSKEYDDVWWRLLRCVACR
ncbi:hypothetical protein GCM10027027_03320 [Neomicrococcus lactis]